MKKYKCIIVDDEQYALNWLEGYVRTLPNLILVNSYNDPLKALEGLLKEGYVDLVILDVNMPLLSGIDLSKQIRHLTNKLIFSTSHRQYGYDAFQVDADAYLLKPFTLSQFTLTINKIFNTTDQTSAALPDDFFFVKHKGQNYKLIKVEYKNVVAVESQRNDVLIHTLTGKILTHITLSEFAIMLNGHSGFEQFQRSFIIGLHHIEHIYGNTIEMVNGLKITVGDYYRRAFSAFISEKILKSKG